MIAPNLILSSTRNLRRDGEDGFCKFLTNNDEIKDDTSLSTNEKSLELNGSFLRIYMILLLSYNSTNAPHKKMNTRDQK